jgi:hypothetical protein
MREASYQDAILLGQQLNLNKDEVWKIVRGVKFNTVDDLGLVVHKAFKTEAPPGSDAEQKERA